MDLFYEKILRPLFFRLGPERAHEYGRNFLQTLSTVQPACRLLAKFTQGRGESIELAGLKFPNHIGLAAGMDKDAEFVPAAAALGFGHVEVGTVTPKPQPGNPQPRLFRYPEHEAIVNRMGFNNHGMEAMGKRLRRLPAPGKRIAPVGVNIGKNKNTALEDAASDYLSCFEHLVDLADYFTVNVSSPNTEGLRELQEKDRLLEILGGLEERNRARKAGTVPIFLKIAPDLTFHQIGEILEVVAESGVAGLVATNTTIGRDSLPAGREYEHGGLSGSPLQLRSTQIIRFISRETGGKLPLIGVGGIHDSASAAEKLDAGAHLIQLYTGWIYRGPFFARTLARSLRFHRENW
ncbi:quinone-dependent dihydroorotate dehydrogenase [Puniceicoccus vermicola]|uniref:Dihydroorotate dehydrogenase (quinone) n=1 Tax=Puniceicoccus vermicola TaxID=388746 RepID=A0A7X1E5J0_9BACT|nr:quinone-dependent dihydroorotate dehydrogenase [Puniceicoccus vermicola]MBC2601657.1 quinone-dependent dihydroorotate dehydrogenase [Puniceicoccus vermicola]